MKTNYLGKEEDQDVFHNFQNPFAVIQAAVDLLNKDPDNIEKVKLACKIINCQASKISLSLARRFEKDLIPKDLVQENLAEKV